MRNLLQKKLNKKGFTLAELLIVVAIIAILVAVAMPVFFGVLDDAREQTWNANARSLKAIGVAEMLSNLDKFDLDQPWYITGTPDGTGDFDDVKFENTATGKEEYENADSLKEAISVKIEKTDVTLPTP